MSSKIRYCQSMCHLYSRRTTCFNRTGYYDGMVRVWGALEDSAPRRFKAHSSYLTNILFFRNNTRLVTNAHTDNARAWDLTDDLSITGSSEM